MKIHLLHKDWYLCVQKEGKCTELTEPALNIWEAPPWAALVPESILKHPCGYSVTTPEPTHENYRLRLHGMN